MRYAGSAARRLTPTQYNSAEQFLADVVVFASGGSDTTPNAFTFTDVTGATRSTVYTSNTITVTGIDAAATISITGGEYQINGGSWVSSSGSVVLNDTVTVRGTSSSSFSTAVNVALTIGGVSDTYTITTAANQAPTDITLSNSSVLTTGGVNAVVGVATVTDADAGDTHTLQMVVGNTINDANNASFNWSGLTLRANDTGALPAGTYHIYASARDTAYPTTAEFKKAFTITVAVPDTGGGAPGQGHIRSNRRYPMRY